MEKEPGKIQFGQQAVYGIHPVEEALNAGINIERIFVQRGIRKETISRILKEARDREIPVQFVPVEKLNRLHRNHQGIAAMRSSVQLFRMEDIISKAYDHGEFPLLIIADRITDVRNLGAMARTCLCCGAHALIIPQTETASLNAEAVKASAGALNRLPVCREKNLVQAVRQLKLNGIQVLAAEAKGSIFIFEADLKIPTAIIVGSEGKGIAPELLRVADLLVKIPMTGNFDSLNVSVAAGMILYEVVRQRLS